MISEAIEIFLLGVTVSFGPCFAFCGPAILSYVGGVSKGWKEALGIILVFSVTQIVIYTLVGILISGLGNIVSEFLTSYKQIIFIVIATIISLIGLVIMFGKELTLFQCGKLKNYISENSWKGSIILGISFGILPCLPFLGVSGLIFLYSNSYLEGAFLGFMFGLGKLVSPLIPLSVLAGSIPFLLEKNKIIHIVFIKTCGLILFLLGVNSIISNVSFLNL